MIVIRRCRASQWPIRICIATVVGVLVMGCGTRGSTVGGSSSHVGAGSRIATSLHKKNKQEQRHQRTGKVPWATDMQLIVPVRCPKGTVRQMLKQRPKDIRIEHGCPVHASPTTQSP